MHLVIGLFEAFIGKEIGSSVVDKKIVKVVITSSPLHKQENVLNCASRINGTVLIESNLTEYSNGISLWPGIVN